MLGGREAGKQKPLLEMKDERTQARQDTDKTAKVEDARSYLTYSGVWISALGRFTMLQSHRCATKAVVKNLLPGSG